MELMLDIYERLAVELGCPAGLVGVLRQIIPGDAAGALLLCAREPKRAEEVAERLGKPVGEMRAVFDALFRDGLVWRRGEAVKAKDMYRIVNRMLAEGRAGGLEENDVEALRRFYAGARLELRDGYLADGKITRSADVLTLLEAFTGGHRHPHQGETHVVPRSKAREIIRSSSAVAVVPCACRATFQRCAKQVNVCLVLGESARELIEREVGRQAEESLWSSVLAVADREGLVHLAVLNPGDEYYSLCSCCRCCCQELGALLTHGRRNWIRKADFVAFTDRGNCAACGTCVRRCVFGARMMADGEMEFEVEKCYGCGLCATTCPEGAITMAPRG